MVTGAGTAPDRAGRRTRRSAVSLLRAALVPLALVVMLGCAGLVLARIYDGALVPRLLVGAAAASVAAGVATRPLPAWSAAPVSLLGLVGYTALAVRLSADAGDVSGGLVDLARDAIGNGIPRVLTAMIPIRPQPDTVVVPVLALWLAGLAAVELALRGRRTLLSYAPVAAFLAAVLYVVGPNAGGDPAPWLPLAFAAAAGMGLAASVSSDAETTGTETTGTETAGTGLSAGDRTALRLRAAAGAAGGLAVVLAAAAAVGPAVAGRVGGVPSDPRRYVTPPRLDSLDESPLARLSGWALDPDLHLFDARISGGDARIRLAVLGDYDGVTWRVGGDYRTAGRVLSGNAGDATGAPAAGREITQRITIDQLDGRLLPAAAVPARIEGVPAAYDQRTTTLALPAGLRPGIGYTVVSRPAGFDVNLLPDAVTPHDAATLRRYATLAGEVPPDLQRLANQLAEGSGSPYGRAQAIERFLAEHYRMVPDAPSGHAYPNLTFFLFGQRNGGGQRGTSEQFAAAFAVLGRAVGLPTRVVVGFETEPGRPQVRGADALAWPEVLFDGLGWVPFDPVPEPNVKPRPVEDDFRPKPTPSTSPPSPAPPPSPSSAPPGSGPASAGDGDGRRAGRAPLAAAVAAGTGLLLVGALAAVPLLRRSRRRRRLWLGDPADRVLGAWCEVLDGLRQAGRDAPASLAATEISGYAALAAGGRLHGARRPRTPVPADNPLDELAALVNAVTFAPGGITADRAAQADRAARAAVRFVAELRGHLPRWRRLVWTFDPRPLWWSGPRR